MAKSLPKAWPKELPIGFPNASSFDQTLRLAVADLGATNHQAIKSPSTSKQTNKQTIKENNSDDTCFGLQAFALKKVRSLSLWRWGCFFPKILYFKVSPLQAHLGASPFGAFAHLTLDPTHWSGLFNSCLNASSSWRRIGSHDFMSVFWEVVWLMHRYVQISIHHSVFNHPS